MFEGSKNQIENAHSIERAENAFTNAVIGLMQAGYNDITIRALKELIPVIEKARETKSYASV